MAYQKTPTITVVTVLKDDASGFLKTAESLLRQRNSSYEWIVVDSSKDTYARDLIEMEHFRQLDVKYIWQEPSGIYQAMNLGWRAAKGEFVIFLNAGDFFASSESTLILNLNTSINLDLIAYPVIHLNSEKLVYAISFPKVLNFGEFEKHAIMNHQGVLIRKSILEKLNGFDESMRFASDGKLLDSALSISNFQLRSEILVAFTYGGASALNHHKVWEEIKTYRNVSQSAIEIWYMGIKTDLRGFVFRTHSNQLLRRILRCYLKRRMADILSSQEKEVARLDLLRIN